MRLADVAHSRDNNFDVLRLAAASIVLVSHSFELSGGDDPVGEATGITLGSLGVALFFAMSGFLILKSWSFQPRVGDFARKRALRIMPALWVAVLLTALVLGPIATDLPLGDYLTSFGTWKYLLLGSVLITFGGVLPGVFQDNPFPDAVNGSLWTLPIEASAYALVALAGVLGLLRRSAFLPVAFVISLAVAWALQDDVNFLNLRLYAFFLAGMLMYAQRERIVLSWPVAIVALAVWAASFDTELLVVASAVTLPYVAMVLAYRTPARLRHLVALGDVSYGLYIYAFPMQQLAAWRLGNDASALTITLIAFPAAWLAGLISWRIVERPALRLKPGSSRTESRQAATNAATDPPPITAG